METRWQKSIPLGLDWAGAPENNRVFLERLSCIDLLPSIRRKVYMILRDEEECHGQRKAQRSGDHWGVEAVGGGADGRGRRPRRLAGIAGAARGHKFCEPASHAGIGGDPGRAREAAGDPLRQRTGVYQPAFSGVGGIEKQIELVHIQPGKPQHNGYVESFNGKLRDECLNVNWFENLWDARQKIAAWRVEYNEERPHSSLGYQTPAAFARQLPPSSGSALRATPDEAALSKTANVV